LYGVQPSDISSIALAILILSSVALVAGYIPARQATAYDPMQVLRYE
jgi:ABC-type antimicrobial peptide transport system permease subunit